MSNAARAMVSSELMTKLNYKLVAVTESSMLPSREKLIGVLMPLRRPFAIRLFNFY